MFQRHCDVAAKKGTRPQLIQRTGKTIAIGPDRSVVTPETGLRQSSAMDRR
jgi:hypothetical protein